VAAYVTTANAYGTPAMIAERFGKPWSAYHSSISAPTWWSPKQRSYQNPLQPQEQFYYSLGTPCAKDDYSSNYAQVAYPSDPMIAGSAPGVDDIATLEKFSCMWSGQPQPYWATGNGHPSMPLRPRVIQQWDPYGRPQQPVDIARAYGASEAAGCSYMVFQDGQIACGKGGNTVRGLAYFKPFPSNFVPTAASITNNSEFLLVTGWDKNAHQGQLAVLAMGSSTPTGTFWDYEWNEVYPGFRNYGLPGVAKLLGIFNLPGIGCTNPEHFCLWFPEKIALQVNRELFRCQTQRTGNASLTARVQGFMTRVDLPSSRPATNKKFCSSIYTRSSPLFKEECSHPGANSV
jgi:hypothetical protein